MLQSATISICVFLRYWFRAGWFRSLFSGAPVDRFGSSLPWLTYPIIRFLGDRLRSDIKVLEFGGGGSTLWFLSRVARVVTIESSRDWYGRLLKKATAAELHYAPTVVDYLGAAGVERAYDLVLIDGVYRVACCIRAVKVLRPGGVIILDDSERFDYLEAEQYLEGKGFRRLDFWGLAPGINYEKCTSVFYRPGNCLAI